MVLKRFVTFIVVERQFTPSWLHLNIGPLLGVIVPVFFEFTGQDQRLLSNPARAVRSNSIQFQSRPISFSVRVV